VLRNKGIPKDRNGKRTDEVALKRTMGREPQNEIYRRKSHSGEGVGRNLLVQQHRGQQSKLVVSTY
jgi:hypothetical protein